MNNSRVIIIGGGYAGCHLARLLDKHTEVLLIDPKEAFIHTPATIRAVIDPSLINQLIIPYGNFLKNGRLIQGYVKAVHSEGVILSDGQSLESDVVVIASGSAHSTTFKQTEKGIPFFKKANQIAAEKIRDAASIAIVGAGPVGIELAGEIAYFSPNKKVHLFSNKNALLPEYQPGLGRKLKRQLSDLDVSLHFANRVSNLETPQKPYQGHIELEAKSKVDVELVFPTIGSRPNNDLLRKVADVQFDKIGRAMHDGWMRPSPSHSSLFVVGDTLSTSDAMTIVAISRQAPWLAKAIKHLLSGNELHSYPVYTPWKLAPILLPLGPKNGSSLLPLGKNGVVVGDFITSRLKGRNLFINKYKKFFRQA